MRKRVLMSSVAATVVASMFMFTGCGSTNSASNDEAVSSSSTSTAASSVAAVATSSVVNNSDGNSGHVIVPKETVDTVAKTACMTVEGISGVQVVGYNVDGSVLNKSRTNTNGEVCFAEAPATIEVRGSGLQGGQKVRCTTGVQAYVLDGKVRCDEVASSGLINNPDLFRSLLGSTYEALGVPFNAYDKAILTALKSKTITGALKALQNFTYLDSRNRAQNFKDTAWKQDTIEHVVNIYNSKVSDDTKYVIFCAINGLIQRGPLNFIDNSNMQTDGSGGMSLDEYNLIHLFDSQYSYNGAGQEQIVLGDRSDVNLTLVSNAAKAAAAAAKVVATNALNNDKNSTDIANALYDLNASATDSNSSEIYLAAALEASSTANVAGTDADSNKSKKDSNAKALALAKAAAATALTGGMTGLNIEEYLTSARITVPSAGHRALGVTVNLHDTILKSIERFLHTYKDVPGGVDREALALKLISDASSGNAFGFTNDPTSTTGLKMVNINADGSYGTDATGEFIANCVTNKYIECAPPKSMFVADGFNTAHQSGDKFMINNISSVCGSAFTKLDANGDEIDGFDVPARFTNSQRYIKFSEEGLALDTESQFSQMQNYLKGAISMELANQNVDITDLISNGDGQGDYINGAMHREHEVIASFVLEFPERCDEDTIEEYLTISYRARYIPLSLAGGSDTDAGGWALVPLASGDDGEKATIVAGTPAAPETYTPFSVEFQDWIPHTAVELVAMELASPAGLYTAKDSKISLVQGSNDNGITADITDVGKPDNDPAMTDHRIIPPSPADIREDSVIDNHDNNNYQMNQDASANVMVTVRAYDEVVGDYIEFQKHIDVEHFPVYISGREFNPFSDMVTWLDSEIKQVKNNQKFINNDRTIQPLDYELIKELLVSNFSNAKRANKPESGEPGPFVTKFSMVRYADDEQRVAECLDRTWNRRAGSVIEIGDVNISAGGVMVFDDANDWNGVQPTPVMPCLHVTTVGKTQPAEVPAKITGEYPYFPLKPVPYNRTNNFAERIVSLHRISNRTPEQEHLLAMFESQLNFVQNPGTMNPAAYKMLVGHNSNNTWGDEDSHIDDDLTYIYDEAHTKINAIEVKTCLTDCCGEDDDD